MALIKDNNAQFQQLLGDYLPKTKSFKPKKEPKEAASQNDSPVPKPRIPYSEMPFWKANPHIKPLVPEGPGITLEAIKELQAFFQDPECPPIEWWIEQLD